MDTSTNTFTVTDRAFRRIAEIIATEPGAIGLRVQVNGGGCSGFQYEFAVERNRNADDVTREKDGVTVLVDELSLQYMGQSEIDYVDGLIGAKFEIKNPHAKASCGCGTSFSL